MEETLSDIEHFYEFVTQIKRRERKYLSNYFLPESSLLKMIEKKNVTYAYKEGEYLNLWWRKEHFKKLYYFIAEPDQYRIGYDSSACVCDVIGKNKDLQAVEKILTDAGMLEYSSYSQWVCQDTILLSVRNRDYFEIVCEDEGSLFIEKLYLYFDIYSDLLPDWEEVDEFIKDKHFIGIHDKQKKKLIAGLVYSKRGCVITEEFVFVVPSYRGQGVSKRLHNALYEKYSSEKIKYVAWVREDNLESIHLHGAYHYKKQNYLKTTFLRKESVETDNRNKEDKGNGTKGIKNSGRTK